MKIGYTDCECMDSCNEHQYIISDMSMSPINVKSECTIEAKNARYRTGHYFEADEEKQFRSVTTQDRFYDLPVLIGEKLRYNTIQCSSFSGAFICILYHSGIWKGKNSNFGLIN